MLLGLRAQFLDPVQILMQDNWQCDRAIFILIVFKERDHEPRRRKPRAIQCVDEFWLFLFMAVADLRSARLEIGAVRDRRDLVITVLSWEINFDVDRFRCGK